MARLEKLTALVTGAGKAGGIGRAIAVALAEEGADVAISDLPILKSDAEGALREIEALGGRGLVALGDVSRVADCRRLVQEAIDGLGRLDLLVNNAGGGTDMEFLDTDEAHYHEKLDVNLKGPFFLSQAAARHMLERGSGKIVNISSELNYIGAHDAIPYSMAKAGIRTMTKALAQALAPTIHVNTVAPGPTASQSFIESHEYTDEVRLAMPLQRFIRPEEVARTVVFLASSDGDCYTGQTLDPNGGAVMN